MVVSENERPAVLVRHPYRVPAYGQGFRGGVFECPAFFDLENGVKPIRNKQV